jgi:hypothetical protein
LVSEAASPPACPSGAAQLLQKREPSLFSAWHRGHSTGIFSLSPDERKDTTSKGRKSTHGSGIPSGIGPRGSPKESTFRYSGMGVFAVFDPVDINPLQGVVNPIENPEISDTQAMPVFSRQLQTARRAGILRKLTDLLDDPFEGPGLEPVEVFLRRREDINVMHGVS